MNIDRSRIALHRRDGSIRAYVLVDEADRGWMSQWTWRMSGGYAVRYERRAGKLCAIYMHRQILGLEPGDAREGEHKNRRRLDCRRMNLRVAERGQKDNQQNLPSFAGSSSRYRGVSWHSASQKWQAYAGLDGKFNYLGLFVDEDEAAAVAAAWRAAHMPFSEDAVAA